MVKKDLRKEIIESLTGEKKLKQEIENYIMWYELRHTGLKWINGGDVIVKNLKIDRKNKIVKADVTLLAEDLGDERYRKEIIKGCEYPFDMFRELKK